VVEKVDKSTSLAFMKRTTFGLQILLVQD